MTSADFSLDPGALLAGLIIRADAAFQAGDASTVDGCYREAQSVADTAGLRAALAEDHVGRLLNLGRPRLALTRCDAYLAAPGVSSRLLRLRRAEILSQIGAYPDAEQAVADLDPMTLDPANRGRLVRVRALAAAARGESDRATELLAEAARLLRVAGDHAAADRIDDDQHLLDLRLGRAVQTRPDRGANRVADSAADNAADTVAEALARAAGLRAQWRYEQAEAVLAAIDVGALDPALRFPVLAERYRLLRLLRADESADALTAHLVAAATDAADPAAEETLALLLPPVLSDGPQADPPRDPDLVVQYARRLILANRLALAEQLLVPLHPTWTTVRQRAAGQLALGELLLAWFGRRGLGADLDAAGTHLAAAVASALTEDALVETRVLALRTLGRAYYARAQDAAATDQDQRAIECWSAAHALEEQVARRQDSPAVRVSMLLAATDEHDERVRATASAIERRGGAAAAAMAVAIEAARGDTLLDSAAAPRALPRPSDPDAAWRWVREFTRELPADQAAWLLYQTPDHLHHVLLGRGLLHHVSTPAGRVALGHTIAEFTAWTSQPLLETGMRNGTFDDLLRQLAGHVRATSVLALLSDRITRLVVLAGGDLADIPFAALPDPGPAGFLGRRYALSELPNLAARRPLRDRAARQRGDRSLLISPPDDALTAAAPLPRRRTLDGTHATVARLAEELSRRHPGWLRVDSHGHHDANHPDDSWLRFATDDADHDGRLRADTLRGLPLDGCGTVVLGACESGMAQRRGRDERVGFVRAALQAGAGAVVAARWVAEDEAAAGVLDRLDRYLRWLPRDVALHRAQLNLCTNRPDLAHPARWACWALYGDPGWQTSAGPLRRLVRRRLGRTQHRRSSVVPQPS